MDFAAGRIELQARTTKNKHPRYLPIYGDMAAEINMALSMGDPACPFLVQRDSAPVFDFEKVWRKACKTAGIEAALFHDLRRTAVTNMIEAGLSEKEAMEISGHKTRSIFDRYHIVSERRLKQNAQKLEDHLKAKMINGASIQTSEESAKLQDIEKIGEPGGGRTHDHRIKSAMLYH